MATAIITTMISRRGSSGDDYWPEEMAPQTLYTPVERGFEARIAERLAHWEALRVERARDVGLAEDLRRFTRFAWPGLVGSGGGPSRRNRACDLPRGERGPRLERPGGWGREAVLAWLDDHALSRSDLLIGIDFSPSLPFADRGAYFPGWDESPPTPRLVESGRAALRDEPHLSASTFAEHGEAGRHYRHMRGRAVIRGDRFEGTLGRLRETERRCRALGLGNAVSGFNLIGAAQVGKSSLTGMRLLHRLGGRVPMWPFDPVPASGR
jgi:hypothetical protein